jgi:transposase, IS30 family
MCYTLIQMINTTLGHGCGGERITSDQVASISVPLQTEDTRYQIALLFGGKISLTEISQRVGVGKSTISRKVRRNSMAGGYSASEAQWLSEARRRSAAKQSISPDTVLYVETGLCWKWSPEQISAICKRTGSPVSHEWIYQHVQTDKVNGGELYRHLRQGRRRYRKGYRTRYPASNCRS